jgi:hypothetical protein
MSKVAGRAVTNELVPTISPACSWNLTNDNRGRPNSSDLSSSSHQMVELSEFPRNVLEALRQPLEDGRVAVVRGQHVAVYPTRFRLVASTNRAGVVRRLRHLFLPALGWGAGRGDGDCDG